MLEWQWPWAFALLPLPLLVRWVLRPMPVRDAALRVPHLQPFMQEGGVGGHVGLREHRSLWLPLLIWCCLLLAAARPQWLGEAMELPVSGRDLMMAVDLSGSMEVEDFELSGRMVNRLVATQVVGSEFIQRREGDRIGLILFGEQAYLQAPLTFDRQTVTTLLQEAAIGLAGDSTSIGDAIGLAIKRLRDPEQEQRVLILLTDGANTSGELSPIKAAELANDNGLRIYTIGIGADEMIVRSLFGNRRVNPSANLDELTLQNIAETTGGRYFRARDMAELNRIYGYIDELEPVSQEKQLFRPTTELYHWPLALAVLMTLMALLWNLRGRKLWRLRHG